MSYYSGDSDFEGGFLQSDGDVDSDYEDQEEEVAPPMYYQYQPEDGEQEPEFEEENSDSYDEFRSSRGSPTESVGTSSSMIDSIPHVDVIDVDDPSFDEDPLEFFILNCYCTVMAMRGHTIEQISMQLSELIGVNASIMAQELCGYSNLEMFLDAEFNKSIFTKKITGMRVRYYARPNPRFAEMQQLLAERTRYEEAKLTPEERRRREQEELIAVENAKSWLKNRYDLLKLFRDCNVESEYVDIPKIHEAYGRKTQQPFTKLFWSDHFECASMLKTFGKHFSRDINWYQPDGKPMAIKFARPFRECKAEIIAELKRYGEDTAEMEAESEEPKLLCSRMARFNEEQFNFFNSSHAKSKDAQPSSSHRKPERSAPGPPKGDMVASIMQRKLKKESNEVQEKTAQPPQSSNARTEEASKNVPEASFSSEGRPTASQKPEVSCAPRSRITVEPRSLRTSTRPAVAQRKVQDDSDSEEEVRPPRRTHAAFSSRAPTTAKPKAPPQSDSEDSCSEDDSGDDGPPLVRNTAPRPTYSNLQQFRRPSSNQPPPASRKAPLTFEDMMKNITQNL